MTDILERLRLPTGANPYTGEPVYNALRVEAADEIARLRAVVAAIEAALSRAMVTPRFPVEPFKRRVAEIRAALRRQCPGRLNKLQTYTLNHAAVMLARAERLANDVTASDDAVQRVSRIAQSAKYHWQVIVNARQREGGGETAPSMTDMLDGEDALDAAE